MELVHSGHPWQSVGYHTEVLIQCNFFCSVGHMKLGSVIIVCVRSKNFSRGRIVEANCIPESTPPPHFGLDVVYKMGGRINGTLRVYGTSRRTCRCMYML